MDLNRLQNYLSSKLNPPDENGRFTDEQNQINILLNKWLTKITTLNTDKAALIEMFKQKGFVSEDELINYVEGKIKEIKDKNKEKQEAQIVAQQKESAERANEQKQDEEHNDLFELTMNNGNFMLQGKDALLRDLHDRQRNVFDRNLKLLEALEAIRKISRQTDGMLQIDLSHMQNLDPKVFEMQKDLLSRFKVKAMIASERGLEREAPEREITVETVTKEQLERGEVTFAIPFRELQSPEWERLSEKFRNQMKDYLNRKGIQIEEHEPVSVEDNVINAIAGTDRTQQAGQRKVEDDGYDR